MICKIREYFNSKTKRQKVLLFLGTALMLLFVFFIIKGNFFDKKVFSFHVNVIDLGILAAVFTAYAIHKIRENYKN